MDKEKTENWGKWQSLDENLGMRKKERWSIGEDLAKRKKKEVVNKWELRDEEKGGKQEIHGLIKSLALLAPCNFL